MTKTELFLKLAAPDKNGVSRWVYVSEFVGEYADLTFGNGASWARKESTLAKKYNVEFYKKDTPGNSIDRIRLNGFNNGDYSQHINASIKREIRIHHLPDLHAPVDLRQYSLQAHDSLFPFH